MITIPFIIIFILLAYFQGKFIRKHNVKLYIIATILSIVAFVLRNKVPITEPFNQGYIGLALLYIVMIAGALENKSTIRKKIMGVRREYSIIGVIMITPHGLKYFIEFLLNERSLEWLGVIPYVIMIPLFITSFMVIRKKFTQASWIKIQKFAYLVYPLIYVHLLFVAAVPQIIQYSIMFIPYFVLKVRKEYLNYKKK